jgi:hypothetical protein
MAAPFGPGQGTVVLADPILGPTKGPPLLNSQIQQRLGHPLETAVATVSLSDNFGDNSVIAQKVRSLNA